MAEDFLNKTGEKTYKAWVEVKMSQFTDDLIHRSCGEAVENVAKASTPAEKFVAYAMQDMEFPPVEKIAVDLSKKRVVQLHLQIALFERFLYRKQQLCDESGRSLEQQKVRSLLQGLYGGLRVTLVGLKQDCGVRDVASKPREEIEAPFRPEILVNEDNVPISLAAEGQGFVG